MGAPPHPPGRSGSAGRQTIDQVLESARLRLRRVGPEDAAGLAAADGVLIDIRPIEQRRRDGEIPGAEIVPRNVLEWRLDPASPARLPAVDATYYERPVIVFCDEGYASSLAAVSLQDLGLEGATDLDGGFQAWKAAGLPAAPADPAI